MSIASEGTLLVVCAANRCRSPYAQVLLADAFPELRVHSAGVSAHDGDPICAATLDRLRGRGLATEHRAARVDRSAVDAAGLILTASSAQRSAIARLVPSARGRTFTVVEAASFAEHVAGRPTRSEVTGLGELAAALHHCRGRVGLPRPTRQRPWSRAGFGIDIPDVHLDEVSGHAVVHRAIDGAVERLHRAVRRWSDRA